jgi:hypothetical protein
MSKSTPISSRERRTRMRESREAIGRLLHIDYVPMLAEPLPNELRHLLAQLIASEACGEEPTATTSPILGFRPATKEAHAWRWIRKLTAP